MSNMSSTLDLDNFLAQCEAYFSRKKSFVIQGDSSLHFDMILEISKVEFKSCKNIENLDTQLIHLSKQGILHIKEIYEFVKIIDYINYLKTCAFIGKMRTWLDKIIIPNSILEIIKYFDEKGQLKQSIDERFGKISNSLNQTKEAINVKIRQIFATKKLDSYLVDRQIHFLNSQEALLVRGGFNHALKATVIGRSSGGFFYVVPESLHTLKQRQSELLDEKETIILEYCKTISSEFAKNLLFLKFINKEFDRFDHYNARVNFAKDKNLEFLLPNKSQNIKLCEFKHPALKDPKPINVDFSGKVLMITGVNAGGKTMLLKSILSAAFLAKYLIPLPINANKSSIGSFKNIEAIIEDPQNASGDISTFAGRMIAFSKLFTQKECLVGVDEIELGTDADEAASLFFVIIKKLMEKNIKLIITTHHKRLASLLATTDGVELKAALYDEEFRKPTFEFIKGIIGKSYAFETAARYGISQAIVGEAKKVYGEDKEKLNELIQKNIDLELLMREKLKLAEEEKQKASSLKQKLQEEKEIQEEEFKQRYQKLEFEFQKAIDEAKKAAKQSDFKSIHQGLNKAHNAKKMLKPNIQNQKPLPLKVGDRVKYGKSKGIILSIKKNYAIIESNGIKLTVPLSSLKRSNFAPLEKKSTITLNKTSIGGKVELDLHGLRADEAIEKLDKFLSDALINGLDEVLVYHGIGTGKLSYAVSEFLKTYPSVVKFEDAPPSMGGFGAKVITL